MPYTPIVFRMRWFAALALAVPALIPLVLASTAQAGAQPVLLETADSFAVLAGSTITNAGPTLINGSLGLHPGSAVVGFPPATVNGAKHVSDAAAQQAATDLTTAYDDAAGRPSSATLPADIGGRTVTGGVYKSVSSLGLTGRLTLDAQGNPRAVFIFQIPSTLVTATDSNVRLVNGAQACNVFWQVGSSATLGTRTAFQGNVLALTSISVNDAATVNGRLLARNGAVTLINNTVTRSQCAAGTGPGTAPGPGTSPGPGASPAPQALDVRLSKPAVIGRVTSIVVETTDTRAPVNALSVQFGDRRDVFGLSACQLPGSRGKVPRAFRPGTRTRLAAPHRFRKRGKQKVVVRIDSGGCSSPPTSVYQTVTVTPTSPGERPRPLVVGAPTLEKPPGTLLPPILPAIPGFDPIVPGLPDLPAAGAVVSSECSGADTPPGNSRASRKIARRALLCLLNQNRRDNGLKSLRENARLLRAAEGHSRSMVKRGFFSHDDPGGETPIDRVRRSGYLSRARSYTCAENIGFGAGTTSSPRSMMQAWMASAPHRANILTASFREVGIGGVPGIPGGAGALGGTYTTVFGVRR